MPGIHKVLNMCEYALELCTSMSEYARNRTYNNCTSQVTFLDTYVHLEFCQTSKMVSGGASCKKIIVWNFFPKTLQYAWQGSKYRRTSEYSGSLNMLLYFRYL